MLVDERFMSSPSKSDLRNGNEEPFITVILTQDEMCFVPILMSL